MIEVKQVDVSSNAQVKEFIQFHYDLYHGCPQWVPPFRNDIKEMMDKKKHPFYEHSDADFFAAYRDGKMVGRIAASENRPFNDYHKTRKASFYLFDAIDDQEVANALFERLFAWCRSRGLTEISGPKGFSVFDGYGIQVLGFEHRQMMTMMNYNYAYYPTLFETAGFERENDFVSCYIPQDKFELPPKVQEIAKRVEERGTFWIKSFKNKRELAKWAKPIGEVYNRTFINNWEYYPLSEGEINYLLKTIMTVADPKFIKLVMYKDEIIGFLFAFPDISAALQRHDGHLNPIAILDLLLEFKRTKWVSLNGVGVVSEYQGRGGNALMYYEMKKTIKDYGFEHAEQTQMADTAIQVRKDMVTLGATIYKKHRIYHIQVP